MPSSSTASRAGTRCPLRVVTDLDLDLYLSLDRTLHIVGSMIFVSRTSETGELNRRRMPLPALVVAGLIFVGSAVGSAVVGYYVEMGLDAMHEALADDGEEEEEEKKRR